MEKITVEAESLVDGTLCAYTPDSLVEVGDIVTLPASGDDGKTVYRMYVVTQIVCGE
jgi:hypothetical protein